MLDSSSPHPILGPNYSSRAKSIAQTIASNTPSPKTRRGRSENYNASQEKTSKSSNESRPPDQRTTIESGKKRQK
jgi:hypothetical protein